MDTPEGRVGGTPSCASATAGSTWASPATAYRDTKELGGATVLIHVYVDDVDAHYARANEGRRRRGGRARGTGQYGDRVYRATAGGPQVEHNAQHVRDVPVEEWSS